MRPEGRWLPVLRPYTPISDLGKLAHTTLTRYSVGNPTKGKNPTDE